MKALRLSLVLGILGLAGCPGPGKAFIPVDSPLRTWQKPEISHEPAPAPPEAMKKTEKKK